MGQGHTYFSGCRCIPLVQSPIMTAPSPKSLTVLPSPLTLIIDCNTPSPDIVAALELLMGPSGIGAILGSSAATMSGEGGVAVNDLG